MFLFMLGMLVCVGIAIVIIALIASPSFREGERFFTPEGEERVQNMRRRAVEDATRGREAVRSAVTRRRERAAAAPADEEPVDVPNGPEYRISDIDGHDAGGDPEDRSVRMAGPDPARERIEHRQDHHRSTGRRFEPEQIGDATGREDRTASQRRAADRPAEDHTVALTQVEDRQPTADRGGRGGATALKGPAAGGAVEGGNAARGGATAIGPVARREASQDRQRGMAEVDDLPAAETTRFDLPAVSRHEEAYEQDADGASDGTGKPLRATRGPRPTVVGAATPTTVRDEPEPDETTRDGGGGFMTRITGSLNRSGTDRTRTGPRHARG